MLLTRKPIYWLLLLSTFVLRGQGQIIEIGNDSIALYVEDTGRGKPIIFIPGWTMTTEFFSKQRDYFGSKFRYISYDPRSHGKSSKTAVGHTYKNHAEDLHAIVELLDLQDITLVGWSSGCATIYEYVQLYGTDDLNYVVFIDEPPKWIGNTSDEWVYGTFDDYRESLKDLINDRKAYASGTAQWMTQQKLDTVQKNWMVDQMLMTANDAALSLYIDGMASDYTEVLIGLNQKVPMLFMLRESWYGRASEWLTSHVPKAKVVSISSHATFWEKPGDFNKTVLAFITNEP